MRGKLFSPLPVSARYGKKHHQYSVCRRQGRAAAESQEPEVGACLFANPDRTGTHQTGEQKILPDHQKTECNPVRRQGSSYGINDGEGDNSFPQMRVRKRSKTEKSQSLFSAEPHVSHPAQEPSAEVFFLTGIGFAYFFQTCSRYTGPLL